MHYSEERRKMAQALIKSWFRPIFGFSLRKAGNLQDAEIYRRK